MYRVKCLCCRNTGDGETINQAFESVPHTAICDANKLNVRVHYDSIDLTKSSDF